MGALDFLFGKERSVDKYDTQSQGQQDIMGQIFQMLSGSGGLGGGTEEAIAQLRRMVSGGDDDQFESKYRERFESQTVPNIAERFAGQGALSSSGFGQALGGAGAQLEADLATMGSERQRGSIQDILQMFQQQSGQALGTDQFQYMEDPASGGAIMELLNSAAKGGDMGSIISSIMSMLGGK